MDKYGRRVEANNAEKELKRFYHIEDEDEEEEGKDDEDEEQTLSDLEREIMADEGNLQDESSESEESEDDDQKIKESIKKPKLKFGQKGYDPMRGKGVIDLSSEEDTSDEESEEEEEETEEEVEVPVSNILYINNCCILFIYWFVC